MSRPLRVAHVVATSGATGVEAHLLALLVSFDPGDVAPVLFSPGPGPLLDQVARAGVPVEHIAPRRLWAIGEYRAMASRWSGHFDLVHAHGPRALFWALRAAVAARIGTTVATLHEATWRTRPGGVRARALGWLEERALDRCTRLIAVSECMRALWVDRRPAWADRVWVVPGSSPALLPDRALPRATPRVAGASVLRLVTVGRLSWAKGTERLLDAVARVRADGGDVALTVVGDGPDGPALHERARRLGIADSVVWVPACDDVPATLAAHDAFITASRHESFGIAVLEAMAVGLAVIAPAVGALPELIRSDETGLLVPDTDDAQTAEALALAIRRLAGSAELAARLGHEARRAAVTRFSPEGMARETARVYRQAASISA